MKNIFASLTCLLVLCALLAGCAQNTDSGAAPGENPSAPALSAAGAEKTPGTETQTAVPGAEALPPMRGMGNSALNIRNTGYAVLSGGRLFFADWDGVYVMPIDGARPELIKACSTPTLCVLDEWLYYTEDACIYRMRADGTGAKLLAEGVAGDVYKNFMIDGDRLYYLREAEGESGSHIWKTALDGSESARVSDVRVWDFLIYEDHIYYVD